MLFRSYEVKELIGSGGMANVYKAVMPVSYTHLVQLFIAQVRLFCKNAQTAAGHIRQNAVGLRQCRGCLRCVIAQIAPRKNVFVRPPVANLDVLFLVASTTQPLSLIHIWIT